jgi:hypothetical protein
MKKILSLLILSGIIVSFTACKDETLNPLPGWDYAVHGLMYFDGVAVNKNAAGTPLRPQTAELNYAKNFPVKGQDAAKVDFKLRWVSLDNKLTVSKIDIYVRMLESYNDPDGNPKTADLSGNGKGKLYTSISAPTGNRQWNSFSINPAKVYELYKNATVKYDKVNATSVFANPGRPRPVGALLRGAEKASYGAVGADEFIVTFKLYTSDGNVFETFEPGSICGDVTPVSEANSNCQLQFDVE